MKMSQKVIALRESKGEMERETENLFGTILAQTFGNERIAGFHPMNHLVLISIWHLNRMSSNIKFNESI